MANYKHKSWKFGQLEVGGGGSKSPRPLLLCPVFFIIWNKMHAKVALGKCPLFPSSTTTSEISLSY